MMFLAFASSSPVKVEALICEVVEELGWKREYFAAMLQVTPGQLSSQLAGREHVSLRRLFAIAITADGRLFWLKFLPKLADALRVTNWDASAAELQACRESFLWAIDRVQARIGGHETRTPLKAELRREPKKEIA